MAMTAHPEPPALVTLSDQQLAPNLPVELASAALAGAIVEGRFAIRTLGPEMVSPGLARDFIHQTLQSWRLRGLAEDASVIVSELVTNALRHGLGQAQDGQTQDGQASGAPQQARPIELMLLWPAGPLYCVVTDPSASPPVPGEPDLDAEAGRGLHVVAALATEWGWGMLDPSRKAVWASLQPADLRR
jgi:anti-sigma regulatory factor (Ser/Thr protein kinase)